MLVEEGGAEPFAEVLLPVWLDGAPPPKRRPMREIGAAEALKRWQAKAPAAARK